MKLINSTSKKAQIPAPLIPYFLLGLALIGLFIFGRTTGFLDITSTGEFSKISSDGYRLIGDSDVGLTNNNCPKQATAVFGTSAPYSFKGLANFIDRSCESKYYKWQQKITTSSNSAQRWTSVFAHCGTQGCVGLQEDSSDVDFTLYNYLFTGTSGGNPSYPSEFDSEFTLKENIKGKKFRVNFMYGVSDPSDTFAAKSNVKLYLETEQGRTEFFDANKDDPSFNSAEGLLEIEPSILNKDEITIRYKGNELKKINLSVLQKANIVGKLINEIKAPSTIRFRNARTFPLFGCELDSNDLFVTEEFTAGEKVSLYNTRYPVKNFCFDQPAQVLSLEDSGIASTNEVYLKMIQGQSVTVQDGQVIRVNYVMDNTNNLVASSCLSDESYDIEQQTCIGFAQVCSSGVFDSTTGTCVSTTDTTEVCEAEINGELVSGTYDEVKQTCIFIPPQDQTCDIGTFNEETGTCESSSDNIVCPEGYNLQQDVTGTSYCGMVVDESPLVDSETTTEEVKETITENEPVGFFEKIWIWIKNLF